MVKTKLLVVLVSGLILFVILFLLYVVVQGLRAPSSGSDETLEDSAVIATTSLLVAPDMTDQAAVEEYNLRVTQAAQKSSFLTIEEGCVISPLVLDIPLTESTSVWNNTADWQSIIFEGQGEDDLTFSVPAGEILDFTPSAVGLSDDIYRYRCSGAQGTANNGLMYITN